MTATHKFPMPTVSSDLTTSEAREAAVVLDAARGDLLVGTNAHVVHAQDVDHLPEAVHIPLEAREKVPDPDRAPHLCERAGMVGTDLPPR